MITNLPEKMVEGEHLKVSPVGLQKPRLSMDHLEAYQEQMNLLKPVREGFL